MKFKKKPVVIDAIQLTDENMWDVWRWIGEDAQEWQWQWDGDDKYIVIRTLEGSHRASNGDYIIRGIKGEHYPCKPDIFHLTYDPIEE